MSEAVSGTLQNIRVNLRRIFPRVRSEVKTTHFIGACLFGKQIIPKVKIARIAMFGSKL